MSIPRRPLRQHADLFALWAYVVGEPGFDQRTLWLIFLDADNRPLDLVAPITGLPVEVDIDKVEKLMEMVRADIPAEAVVTMISRPGSGRVQESDREWARALSALTADRQSHWPVHLATDDGLRVLAPDDLVHTRSA